MKKKVLTKEEWLREMMRANGYGDIADTCKIGMHKEDRERDLLILKQRRKEEREERKRREEKKRRRRKMKRMRRKAAR